MSAATASSTDKATVHVRLLGEGVDVWRPVPAERLGDSTYRLGEALPPMDEAWSFSPGDVVVVERGETEALIAVARATAFDEPSWNQRRRAG
jgi:hypothetical protein